MHDEAWMRWERWMRLALTEADRAAAMDEVPVGAVVIREEEILGRGYNRREVDQDPLGHAELIALRQAAEGQGSWRLSGCTMIVTLEPCAMCAGALVNSRIDRVVFGARDPRAGYCVTLGRIVRDPRLNHRLEVVEGILAEECGEILRRFFRRLRRKAD
ncbi:MAG: tRNA adenosine(34) deaminase TadA [Thermoanaerobaculia bacterium]|nr:tRNA adenosine(34) deaminase TadA [Thermoanaerobaculia bacterium]